MQLVCGIAGAIRCNACVHVLMKCVDMHHSIELLSRVRDSEQADQAHETEVTRMSSRANDLYTDGRLTMMMMSMMIKRCRIGDRSCI